MKTNITGTLNVTYTDVLQFDDYLVNNWYNYAASANLLATLTAVNPSLDNQSVSVIVGNTFHKLYPFQNFYVSVGTNTSVSYRSDRSRLGMAFPGRGQVEIFSLLPGSIPNDALLNDISKNSRWLQVTGQDWGQALLTTRDILNGAGYTGWHIYQKNGHEGRNLN